MKGDDGTWHELPTVPFARDIAALGVAHWEDITHKDGDVLKYKQFVAQKGLKDGKLVDDRTRKLYHNLKAHVHSIRDTPAWHAWKQQRGRQMRGEEESYVGCHVQKDKYEAVRRVHAWRRAPSLAIDARDTNPLYQSIEYLIEWEGGTRTWEHGAHITKACTTALRAQLTRISKQTRRRKNTSWYDERTQRGINVNTSRPNAQELSLFKEWTLQEGEPLNICEVCECETIRDNTNTMYGGVLTSKGDKADPKTRMAAHAHRSQRARTNAEHSKNNTPDDDNRHKSDRMRGHKYDTYVTCPFGSVEEDDTLPTLTDGEQRILEEVSKNQMDASESNEVREHTIARLFARTPVLELGRGQVGHTQSERLNIVIDKDEIECMDAHKGKALNRKVLTLAMQLHARDHYTDAIACDGSKIEDNLQPWDTTYKVGPTACGTYGGLPVQAPTGTTVAARMHNILHSYTDDMKAAISSSTHGCRIGDEADTMVAELTAILTYLIRITASQNSTSKRVLIMSDCYNALRAIEETWRGRGKPYRQRAGGALIEAINTIREQLGLVVFMYVPSHAGVVPNAYADGVAKACLKRTTRTRTGPMIARLIRSRSVIYEKRERGQSQVKDGPTFRHVKKGIMEWVRGRAKSQYRGGTTGYWNQKVLSTIGRGPPPPKTEGEDNKGHITPEEAKAYAAYATQRMRITCGCRTGMVAGGPQGEKRMERAAVAKGSAAAYI